MTPIILETRLRSHSFGKALYSCQIYCKTLLVQTFFSLLSFFSFTFLRMVLICFRVVKYLPTNPPIINVKQIRDKISPVNRCPKIRLLPSSIMIYPTRKIPPIRSSLEITCSLSSSHKILNILAIMTQNTTPRNSPKNAHKRLTWVVISL